MKQRRPAFSLHENLPPIRGVTLLFVMLILSAILSIALGIFNAVFGQLKLAEEITNSFSAFYAADSAMEQAFWTDRVKKLAVPSQYQFASTNTCSSVTRVLNSGTITLHTFGRYPATSPCTSDTSLPTVKRALRATYQIPFIAPLAYWKLDESGSTATDSSGHGNNATFTGTTVVAGKIGQARNFGADTDAMSTAVNNILNTDTHTVAFWLKITQAPPAAWTQIFSYAPAGTDRSPAAWLAPSTACLHWRYDPGNSGGLDCAGPTGEGSTFTLNTWYHVAGVKSGATFTFYVNGTLVSTRTVANPKTADVAALIFGGSWAAARFALDDVRIYDLALNQAEIQALIP